MQNIKVSILLPSMNVDRYISQAIDSILMQEVNFNYEIIVCDDGSTDNTANIVKKYQEKYPIIKLLQHESNLGLPITNYNLMSNAKGEYFCILDPDDYYTVRNKLQKQVDFLDSDVNNEYIAATHQHIRVIDNKEIYSDLIDYFSGHCKAEDCDHTDIKYFHTATYMYRNIFKGNVPEYFKHRMGRHENARLWYFLKHTGKKIRKLNFVGSAYNLHGSGMWSKLDFSKKKQAIVDTMTYFKDSLYNNTTSEFELNRIDAAVNEANNKTIKQFTLPTITLEKALEIAKSISSVYAFQDNIVFHNLYRTELLDSFCESIGRIQLNIMDVSPLRKIEENSNNYLISVKNLEFLKNGLTNDIIEIIEFYKGSNIVLLITDLIDEKIEAEILHKLSSFKNVNTIFARDKNNNFNLQELFTILIGYNFEKAYNYVGHDSALANSLNQVGIYGKNICVFSYNIGLSFGIDNSSYHCYIARTKLDYALLTKLYKNKVIYIPHWGTALSSNLYVPFNNHSNIITSTLAEQYECISESSYDYITLIAELLKTTKGKHIHYGFIPLNEIERLYTVLNSLEVNIENFILLALPDNFINSLHEQNVDLVILPFAKVSKQMILEIEAAGIPMLCYDGKGILNSTTDYYQEVLKWSSKEEFIKVISNLDKETLLEHSALAKKQFREHHNIDVLKPYFLKELSFKNIGKQANVYYDTILDISILNNIFHSNIVNVINYNKSNSIPSVITEDVSTEGSFQLKKKKSNPIIRMLVRLVTSTLKYISMLKVCILFILSKIPIIGYIIFTKRIRAEINISFKRKSTRLINKKFSLIQKIAFYLKYRYKFVHIMHNDKFNEEIIQMFNDHFNKRDHLFIFYGGYSQSQFNIPNSKNIIVINDLNNKKFILQLKVAKKIILHGLFGNVLSIWLNKHENLLSKCFWVIWGGDLYSLIKQDKTEQEQQSYNIKKNIISKIKGVITDVDSEVDLVKRISSNTSNFILFSPYPNGLFKEYDIKFNDFYTKKCKTILIGNSADPSNNHIEVFYKLQKHLTQISKVICPLSYSDTEGSYTQKVIAKGKEVFKDKFFPITHFIEKSEYEKMLFDEVDVAVFNHERQQAFTTTARLFCMGKKVYLNDKSPLYATFKKNDFKIYITKNINDNNFFDFDEQTIDHNIKCMKKTFSFDSCVNEWKKFFNS
ncbi:TDP-N-acetylfucosamine:lipid II N-acetylfucosaminyltransferase [Rickettsiales bacterium LUAb2]